MEDLLQSQIRESCRLALPEGLKDLMADISREVLRAQPENLYQFIADYLSSLLVAREHLFIAARVCDDVCTNTCCADLEDELRTLLLSEEDVQSSLKIISGYFSSGEVKEGNLLQKLVRETGIDPNALPAVQDAVRRAFMRHQLNKCTQVETSSTDSELDEISLAAKHTLKIYKKVTESPDINYDCVASKIQAAYRAYNVRRLRKAGYQPNSKKKEDTKEEIAEKVRFQVKGEDGKPREEHENNKVKKELESNKEKREFENNKGKKTISFHSLPRVVELDDNEVSDEAEEADYDSEDAEDMLDEQLADEDYIEDICQELPNDNDNGSTLENTAVSELKGNETESSESFEDDVDEVQLDEIDKNLENLNDYDEIASTTGDNFRRVNDNTDAKNSKMPKDMTGVTDTLPDDVAVTEELAEEDYENFLV
ncbi:uncharacterized protein LOC133526769 isoform X2 [Cydia pomonella]|uniref:uncharacterized protein LOC133526769 isoform X2 n=1 Tax=Cydia pomonella TaxID=82600 RepID=UPI002ADE251C|nr:uncharacterized protein LOC133526769 isoform X2 [Cydia pomonella]